MQTKFLKLKEYLDSKGKIDKPTVSVNGDYSPPSADSPEKGEPQKSVDGVIGPKVDNPKPYMAKDEKNPKSDELASAGDKSLVYEPETNTSKGHEIKLKNSKFVKENSSLKGFEYSRKLMEEGSGYSLYMIEAAATACGNDRAMENFVHEVYRQGGLWELLERVLSYDVAFQGLAKINEDSNNKVLKKINEAIGPPIGLDDEEDMGDEDLDDEELDDDGLDGEEDDEELDDEDSELGVEDDLGKDPEGTEGRIDPSMPPGRKFTTRF